MEIVSSGPFRTSSVLWQPRSGAWVLTVVSRASFELAPGESPLVLAEGGDALANQPGGDERWLLEQEIASTPIKRRPEVLVVGHAHAPDGKPVHALLVRLSVGEVDKVLQVVGDRHFTLDGALTDPARFTRMPLGWERAAGGPDTSNPVGVPMGSGAPADAWGRVRAPNLLPVGASIAARADVVPPVGLGPLGPTWPARRTRLHRHALTWNPARWSEQPLPDDFDFLYFNAAPPDQHLNELTGNERIVLEHLHPRFPRLATQLRVVAPRATTFGAAGAQQIPMRGDTLLIDTDRGIATLTWRGHLPLDDPKRSGVVLVHQEEEPRATPVPPLPSAPSSAPSAPATAPGAPRPALAMETMPAVGEPRSPSLPFQKPGDAAASAPAPAPPQQRSLDLATALLPASVAAIVPVAPSPEAAPSAERRNPNLAATLPLVSPRRQQPLPAAWSAEPTPEPEPPTAVPVFGPPPPLAYAPPVPAFVPVPAPAPVTESAAAPAAAPAPAPESASAPAPAPAPVPVPVPVPASDPLPLDAYPIDRCARIAALLDLSPDDPDAILNKHDLRPDRWDALHAHWLEALEAEADRGRNALLSAYDAAYVAQLEEERGPLGAAGYARLTIAAERGQVARALADMGLPRGALMRIRRVWLARLVKDPQLGAEVRAAVRVAAEA